MAYRIEVTQGVQDLNNSVRLVQDKRTFVRVHVRSLQGGNQPTFARLRAQRGPNAIWLNPVNGVAPGFITVRPNPSRLFLDHTFLFELPVGYRKETVTITAYLNPVTNWRGRNPVETTYGNNDISTTVSFEVAPTVHLVTYRIGYKRGATTYWPPLTHVNQMHDWLRRAYPLNKLQMTVRQYDWGAGAVNANGKLTNPNCSKVNAFLTGAWLGDNGPFLVGGPHYYGMVSDGGGFMQGCAPVPGSVASGPTGVMQPFSWWDTDGSYGDWYGGHELAHAYGRRHANFCGATGGSSYPYPDGHISPTYTGDAALYGFDISTRAIYPPWSGDLMTYCDYQWLSDFTYEALLNKFRIDPVAAAGTQRTQQADRLMVVGTIDPATGATELQPLFVLPDVGDVDPATPGDYAIVLRAANGAVLANYTFTPDEVHGGPAPQGERDVDLLAIAKLLPYVAGTVRVDILGPSGLLRTVQAGAAPPTVTVLAPNGGGTVTGDLVVSWTASDPNGDALVFNVQYSPNNGGSWETLAQNLTGSSVTLPAANLVAGNQARIRVLASDGIHTTVDQSDGPFVIPNHPPTVAIRAPANNTTLFVEQSLGLEADAYDSDTGTMDDGQVQWISSRDGLLGIGAQVTIASLSAGAHVITVRADDGQGGVATASVTVTVRADLTEPVIPPVGEIYLPLILR